MEHVLTYGDEVDAIGFTARTRRANGWHSPQGNMATVDKNNNQHLFKQSYNPVTFLSAITQCTFLDSSSQRQAPFLYHDKSGSVHGNHPSPIHVDSPESYTQRHDCISPWLGSNNSIDYPETNTVETQVDKNDYQFYTNSITAWRDSPSSPDQFSYSVFSMPPQSASASLPLVPSSCMHVVPPGARTFLHPGPSPSPPKDFPPAPVTDSDNVGLRRGSHLQPSDATAFTLPAFPGSTWPTNCYDGQDKSAAADEWKTSELSDERESLMAWQGKHPSHWTTGDVLDWIFSVSVEHGLDMKDLRAENFQNVTGRVLCEMNRSDFLQLEPRFGAYMFERMEKMTLYDSASPDVTYQIAGTQSPGYEPDTRDMTHGHMQETPPLFPVLKPEDRNQSFYNDCHDQRSRYSFFCPMRPPCCSPTTTVPTPVLRRRSGRPRVRSLQFDMRDGKEKKAKNQHLWEFIYETLMSPSHNPQFLRWENQREGVFRFVQSEAVAQLWGRRKNNENMTYEKLSRAMRHYYRRGILERVEGRRLVYKFSLKAMDRIKNKTLASL